MTTPFKNDPISITWMAFKKLFPEKDCECWFSSEIKTDEGDKAYGFTDFCDDGSIVVTVDGNLSVEDATEILAHELAHVAVGIEHEHDDFFENAFGMILEEYNKICEELFGIQKS